ncbi:MAG TPA: sigma-70 family RNA polymerase sigma factor [Solirubrobacteraceae bacterium]|nr:sigma-70 family RNA polymerase sigma factor [Solirubrobacteraceae bacterium]
MSDQEPPNSPRISRPSAGDDALLPYFPAWQRDGDERARDLLVERYMPLARSLARRYVSSTEPLEDLVQIASYGLLGAIDRFDSARGVSFSSFAVTTILGELRHYIRDFGWGVHVPRGAQERALEVESAIRELTAGARREPTIPDLAEHLGWSVETVVEALQVSAGRRTSSLDLTVGGDDEERRLADRLGREDAGFDQVDERLSIASGLPRMARQIVRLRFIEDLTQSEIAARVGISQMQVSRILRDSLDQLRAALASADALARREGRVGGPDGCAQGPAAG